MEKSRRALTLWDGDTVLLRCPVALGRCPVGPKQAEGDGKTPEGRYFICLKRETGRFGPALGISYPSAADSRRAAADGRINVSLLPLFEAAEADKKRPPWGTPLGGEIYLHGGGAQSDWTAGCIALNDADMAVLFARCREGDGVEIIP